MYKNGGGIEEHLNTVDKILLERNRLTLLRVFEKLPDEINSITSDNVGIGQRIWIPIQLIEPPEHARLDLKPFLHLFFPVLKGNLLNISSKLLESIIKNFRPLDRSWFYCNYKNLDSFVSQLYTTYHFDLAVIHTMSSVNELGAVSQLVKLQVPFLLIHHFESNRLNDPLVKIAAKKAIDIGAVSTANVPWLFKKRLYHLIEGVDSDYFNIEKAATFELRRPDKLIFMPARIHPKKGQADAIRAFYLLRQNGYKAKLFFAGRTDCASYVEELKHLIKTFNLFDSIEFLGRLDKQQLRNWYAEADIVILPSYSEGLGRTLLEGQLMKRPVVAYKVGGVSEAMIDGVTGFLVKKGDVSEFALRLKQLIADDNLRSKMGEAGRAFVSEKFSLQKMVESHEALYLRALSKTKR